MKIAAPLIISTGAFTVRMFTDRLFLAWYTPDAMTGAMFAGILHFTLISLFYGIVSYTNTFVAQYTGARQNDNIGPVVWQGIYLSIVMGLSMLLFLPFSKYIFGKIGHAPEIIRYELEYFNILLLIGIPLLMNRTLSAFYAGRGQTSTVMWVNIFNCLLNVGLDYILIFGHFGSPRLGVSGAAMATVMAEYAALVVFVVLFFLPENRRKYNTLRGRGLNVDILRRLLKYGFPSGLNFILDMLAFSIFLTIVGRFGRLEQTATSMVFSINMFAFMPMIGLGIGVSILVGQYLGRNEPDIAERSVWMGFKLCIGYMGLVTIGYVFFGRLMLLPYSHTTDIEVYNRTVKIAVKLMYFIAAYSLMDSANIIFSNALKGAGDTRFVMLLSVSLNWLLMVIPCAVAAYLGLGLYTSWTFLTTFVIVLGICFFLRFRSGVWKSMRVIDMRNNTA